MARRKKPRSELEDLLQRYAATRLHDFSAHTSRSRGKYCSIIDPRLIRVDIYPNRSYRIVYTNYWRITRAFYWKTKQKPNNVGDRKGEKGNLPADPIEMARFLDHIFFDADVLEERRLAKKEEYK